METKKTFRLFKGKLALTALAVAATALVGTASGASATNDHNRPDRGECESNGFRNYGQCVREWANRQGNGNGGGGYHNGNVTISPNISPDITVNGNNNVFNFIVHMIFG